MRFDNKIIIYDLKNNHYLYSTKISLKKNFYNMNNLRKYYEIDKNLITKTNYNSNSLIFMGNFIFFKRFIYIK